MFDNVLYESATKLLEDDIKKNRLPGSILFSGPAASGKLSCALETARVLSCLEKGDWNCKCASCLKHKALVSQNVLVVGPGNRSLEINAASQTFLNQNYNNTSHLEASRYLFIRAVRKLTIRFSPILWEGEDKLSKFSSLLQEIDENLEVLDPSRKLPDDEELSNIVNKIKEDCLKLENTYLYDSVPVSQIRNFSSWARTTSSSGKKVLILENADSMAESARNALLKILEEPPSDTIFILTTANRGAVLPTILSRVRTYSFFERTVQQQQEVIRRVYHYNPVGGNEMPSSIEEFLQIYLSVSPEEIKSYARQFFLSVADGKVPDVQAICAGCKNFNPKLILKVFFRYLIDQQKNLKNTQRGAESSFMVVKEIQKSYNNVTVYNQNPASALEELTRNLIQINFLNDGSLKEAFN